MPKHPKDIDDAPETVEAELAELLDPKDADKIAKKARRDHA